MSVFAKINLGRMAELVDAYALGAYDFGHKSSTLFSPTNIYTALLVKDYAVKTMLRDLLHNLQRVAFSAKGVSVERGNKRFVELRNYCGSLRNYRHFNNTFNSAINYWYIYSFFKFPVFAVVQVVSQQTQHILRNLTVVQSIKGECSRYVYTRKYK